MDFKAAAQVVFLIIGLAISEPDATGAESSLNDSKIELPEGEVVLAVEKLIAENKRLRDSMQVLSEVAANATSEGEVFKRQVTELSQRMEALGASTGSPSLLEQRVLQAANATRYAEINQAETTAALVRLAKISSELARTGSPEVKLVIDAELKKVDDILGAVAITGVAGHIKRESIDSQTLMRGTVSAMKPELECIVINLGQKQGVKVGMPFLVKHAEKAIASLRIVEVRQTFSAAVIQKQLSDKEQVKLGDVVSVDTKL